MHSEKEPAAERGATGVRRRLSSRAKSHRARRTRPPGDVAHGAIEAVELAGFLGRTGREIHRIDRAGVDEPGGVLSFGLAHDIEGDGTGDLEAELAVDDWINIV